MKEMTAAETPPSSASRDRLRRAQRRRRALLGLACAAGILVALGVSLALAKPSLQDRTHSAYLDALHNADRRVADRVAGLRDQMEGHVHQVADLKQQVDDQAQQLTAAKASLEASQEAANQSAAAVVAARSGTQS